MKYKTISLFFLLVGTFFKGFIYCQGDLFISGNSGPIANAGRDIKTLSKGAIFLDGSRSYVTDGSTIKYHWEFSPGLVLSSDNDFSQEISTSSFGETYLKSVTTYKDVLDVKLAENNPGTKLEVVLKIKDRIFTIKFVFQINQIIFLLKFLRSLLFLVKKLTQVCAL